MKKAELAEKAALVYREDIPKAERLRYLCQTNFLAFAAYISDWSFKPYAVHRLVCKEIQDIADGKLKKSIIALPPRAGKSMLVSQLLPAFLLGRNPCSYNMLASYALKLALEHSLKTLQYMNSERYRFIFPEVELKSTDVATTIRLKNGGFHRIFSAGADCTGFSYGALGFDTPPGVAILDDLLASGKSAQTIESSWNWVSEQWATRKLPNHALISMGTRFAERDISGRLLENDKEFKYLSIPALCNNEESDILGRKLGESYWKDTYDENFLAEIRAQIGENTFQTLYQSNPTAISTNIFKQEHFQYWEASTLPVMRTRFLSLDTAFSTKSTADYSVICCWGVGVDNKLYLLDVIRGQWGFPELLKITRETANAQRTNLLVIENKASGQSLIQVLQQETRFQLTPCTPTKDKITRANEIVPTLDKGLVWLPPSVNPDFISELRNFPVGQNDDQTDAFVYGVSFYQQSYGRTFTTPSLGLRLGGSRNR